MQSQYRKFARTGPGGRRCACCYPAPGPARKLWDRMSKKRWNLFTKFLVEEALRE